MFLRMEDMKNFRIFRALVLIGCLVSTDGYSPSSVICNRFPSTPSCQPPQALLPSSVQTQSTVSNPGWQQPAQNSPSVNNIPLTQQQPVSLESQKAEVCNKLMQSYYAYCTTPTVSNDDRVYCDNYRINCLAGNNGVAGPPWPASGLPSKKGKLKGAFASKWMQLTNQAQQEEQRQSVGMTEAWLTDCGAYNLHYNVLCYPNSNSTYCGFLRKACLSYAENAAAGMTPVVGPFAANSGLPTGGAGSSRPLTVGSDIGVGPFFNMGNNLGVNPLQGVGKSTQLSVPIVGLGAQISKGVDYGGLIGISQLGQLLGGGGRRRRHLETIKRTFVKRS